MSDRLREHLIVAGLLIFTAFVFTFGITWGLPSRKTDAFLFDDRKPWTGAEILALAPPRTSAAADVDSNPAVRGSIVNDTDAKRAEIVRRYRLFTYQPDEMITMMSLAQMHPSAGDFDPRLYQYGGLWIYPVGGLIKLLLHPVADPAYYLDHPEQFGKFYVVARAYSAAWGVVGAWATYWLARGCASRRSAILATLLYATMPVVVNMAHEAKPHLPGAALMLLAALAASRYVRQGGWRNFILMSALCGAAAGMILSATVAIIIALVAIAVRCRMTARNPLAPVRGGEGWGEGVVGPVETSASFQPITHPPHPSPLPRVQGRGDKSALDGLGAGGVRVVVSLAIAAFVFFATNPYVFKHLLFDRSVLSANLANSKAMYRFDPLGGFVRAIELIGDGASWLTVVGGVFGIFWLTHTRHRPPTGRPDEKTGRLPALLPLLASSLTVLFQFASLAAGKPGEYARFGLIVDVTLALVAAIAIGTVSASKTRNAASVILLIGTVFTSAFYEYGFWADSRTVTRRGELANQIAVLKLGEPQTLGLWDEPAPYLLPPVDLWKWKIILLHRETTLDECPVQIVVRPTESPIMDPILSSGFDQQATLKNTDWIPADISWANKAIQLWQRPTVSAKASE